MNIVPTQTPTMLVSSFATTSYRLPKHMAVLLAVSAPEYYVCVRMNLRVGDGNNVLRVFMKIYSAIGAEENRLHIEPHVEVCREVKDGET